MIPEAQAFNEAVKAYADAQVGSANHELDQRIAIRDGDVDAVKAADEAKQKYTTDVWYPAYKARQSAAKALVEALGVDAGELRAALACLHALWCHGIVRASALHPQYLAIMLTGYCTQSLQCGGGKADYRITERGKIEARKIFR